MKIDKKMIAAFDRILEPFVQEALPDGGINVANSRWQKPGRGYGGSEGHPDIRYMAVLVDVLYRVGVLTNNPAYRRLADNHVRSMARFASETEPMWLFGTVLQAIGIYHLYNSPDAELKKAVQRIMGWARKHKVQITIGDLTYGHFPCGYGIKEQGLNAKDAGWSNDLSIFGAGLVWAYDVTGDKMLLDEAVNYAEYFIQPWRANALGTDGYWHAGTWSEQLGTWLIGPPHYTGVESINGYTDQRAWVFSALSCIDYFERLYRYRRDERFLDRCIKAAQWTFKECQFEDGGVGICGRDDKWYGMTGCAISQTIMLKKAIGEQAVLQPLLKSANLSYRFLCDRLPKANLDDNGIEWVTHTTLADPLVNVAYCWLVAIMGVLDGAEL